MFFGLAARLLLVERIEPALEVDPEPIAARDRP